MNGDYLSMTVNERLYEAGLLEEFERARSDWNVLRLRQILSDIELPDYDIELLRD